MPTSLHQLPDPAVDILRKEEWESHQPPMDKDGWRWSQQLELYVGIHESQLRFFSPEGELLPSREERAEQQLEKLQQRLQDLGLEP